MPRPLARFSLANPTAEPRRRDALVSGVPLPQGAVCDPATLTLATTGGAPLPTQAEALARWADGSLKWVLLTVPALSLAPRARRRLELRARASAPRPSPRALRVEETAAGVAITVPGRLHFTVAAGAGPLVPAFEVWGDGTWQPRATGMDLVVVVERDGAATEYTAAAAPRRVVVESQGPWRVAIAVHGEHTAADGRRFGPYTLRVEVIAGARAGVRLTHSLIFDGDPQRDFLRAVELRLDAAVGGDAWFAAGGDAGAEQRFVRQRAPAWTPDFHVTELYQDSCSHWRLERWVDPARRAVFAAEGERSDGWLTLGGAAGSVSVAVRECWQNHPKSLHADAASGRLTIGLYPRRAPRLDLQRYSDLVYPHTYEAPCTWQKETTPFNPRFGAHGIRKTHDLALWFDEPNPSGAALALNEPLLLQWAPAWMARCRVVVPGPARVPAAWRRWVGRQLDFLGRAQRNAGGTGYLDYFDLPMGINLDEGRFWHDFGGWGYINDEAMPVLGLWHAWWLTGRRDAYHLARAMGRHNSDIDCHHLGALAGLGSRHNVNHWGDQCTERRISMPLGKRFAWYIGGDRTVMDLAERVLASYRGPRQPFSTNMTCDIPALVATLLFLTECGQVAGDAWLRALADAIAASVDERGRMGAMLSVDAARGQAAPVPGAAVISYMMWSCFGGAQAFAELAERYDHDALRQALVRFARYQMLPAAERRALEGPNASVMAQHENVFRGFDLFAYAGAVSGDAAFARHVAAHLHPLSLQETRVPATRYGRRAAARRLPCVAPWPDVDRAVAEAGWRRYYPLFARRSSGQTFHLAVYLHKLPGLLAALERL